MFSFHKPKIYRSINGCCICKAKSSSSRFTDSKKYEPEFEKCFRTLERRSGEICNACVLLVKRWKKLPPGTQRDWRHVVDARAGPGTKSVKSTGKSNASSNISYTGARNSSLKKLSKPKKTLNTDELMGEDECAVLLPRDAMTPERSDSSDGEDNLDDEFYLSEDQEDYGERNANSLKSKSSRRNRSIKKPRKEGGYLSEFDESVISFLDMSFWRKEEICCGIIFKGPNNEVVVSPKLLKPCSCRKSSIASSPKAASVSTGDNISVSSSLSPARIEEDNESNASSYNSTL